MKQARYLVLLVPALLLAACASTPAARSSGAIPDNWTVLPAFRAHGVAIVSAPPADVQDTAEIVLSAREELTFAFAFINAASGASISDAVEVSRDGANTRVTVSFPADGTYSLTLYVIPSANKQASLEGLATVRFNAKPSAAPAAAPAGWKVSPLFRKLGVAVTASPTGPVTDWTEIFFTSPEDFELAYSFTDVKSGKSVTDSGNWVDFSRDGNARSVLVSFPKSGDYRLGLYAKAKGGTDYTSLATVALSATVSGAATPKGWQVSAASWKYGLRVGAAPEGPVGEWTDIRFTTKQKLSLTHSFKNTDTGEDGTKMDSPVEINGDGTDWTISLYFPKSGTYSLRLWGKAEGAKDYLSLAQVSFSASVQTAAGQENWKINPRFRKYGLTIASAPAREVGETAEVTLSLPKDFQVSASLHDSATGNYVPGASTESAPGGSRLAVLFPKSGDYELTVSGAPKGAQYSQALARASFKAAFDEAVPRVYLWRLPGEWRKLPVGAVAEIKGEWAPLEGYWSVDSHSSATLTADLAVPLEQAALTIPKGSRVEFSAPNRQVEALSYVLPKDLAYKAEGTTLSFKAGTTFSFNWYTAAGTLAKDAVMTMEGISIPCPKGARILVEDGEFQEVTPVGTGSVTQNKQTYQYTGSAVVVTYYGEEGYNVVQITTAKAYPFKVGTTSFTLPAGSLLSMQKDGIEYYGFAKDFDITVNGEKKTIPAGWAIRFDAANAMEQFQME